MKKKIYDVLSKPYMVVLTMLIAPLLGYLDRNFVFFFGLGVAIFILWGSDFDWPRFGFAKKIDRKTVLRSLLITLIFIIGFNILLEPILERYLGEFDLSSLEDIRGNFVGYIIILCIIWVFAAFGEEFLFRGYYMKAFAELLGNSTKTWFLSAIITSIYFGVSHGYQGLIGIVTSTLFSFCLCMIFIKNRDNLILLVLVHGFYDTVGITLIYLDKDRIITDWIQQIL